MFITQLKNVSSNDKLILHVRAQAEENSYETKNEFLEFVQHCFQLAKTILNEMPEKSLNTENLSSYILKLEGEKLAIQTTFLLNLISISIKAEGIGNSMSRRPFHRRFLTDFLQNTCVPFFEIQNYPNYFNKQAPTPTPFIEKSFKPMSPSEKAQRI